jgi:hypothetical protein
MLISGFSFPLSQRIVGETFNTNNDSKHDERKMHLSFNGIYTDFLGKEKVSTIWGILLYQRKALLGTYSTRVK